MRQNSELIYKDFEKKLSVVLSDKNLAQEIIEMHKSFVKSLRNYTEHYGKLAKSANLRSNDNTKDLNKGIFNLDQCLIDIGKLRHTCSLLNDRITYLELPWYKKIWKKIISRN